MYLNNKQSSVVWTANDNYLLYNDDAFVPYYYFNIYNSNNDRKKYNRQCS